jgi:hypothetical protein
MMDKSLPLLSVSGELNSNTMDNETLKPLQLKKMNLRAGDRFKISQLGETFRVQCIGSIGITTINERTQKPKTIFWSDIPTDGIYLITEKIQ